MKYIIILLSTLLCFSCDAKIHKSSKPVTYESTYNTPFGPLKQEYESTNYILNGKLFMSAPKKHDGYASSLSLSYMQWGFQLKDVAGEPILQRVIIGIDSTCTRYFVIFDFTGKKPFISKPFGYNPEAKYCLEFQSVKWGEKESYIYLEGPMKYLYYTGGAVVGPL